MFKSQEQADKVVEILKESGYHKANCEDYTDHRTFFEIGRNIGLKFTFLDFYADGFEINATGMVIRNMEDAKKYAEELNFLSDVIDKLNKVLAE
ncbi:hypothetical protein [Bacillus sp. NEAU-Y102]